MNQTAEEATENVLTQQIPEVMRFSKMFSEIRELHVNSIFFSLIFESCSGITNRKIPRLGTNSGIIKQILELLTHSINLYY
jgi:hypothetical protein